MMDMHTYDAIASDVKKRCKRSKKSLFDTTWKIKYREVMKRSISDIYYFILHGDSNQK